jgi:DNA-binding CsgD family transcriptional regulator
MPRISKAQELAREQTIELSNRLLEVDGLGRAIVGALGGAVGYGGYRLLGIDPTTLLVNRVIVASDYDGWARSEWLRDVYLRADDLLYIELSTIMRLGLAFVAVFENQSEAWGYSRDVPARVDHRAHRRVFHELRSPRGGTLCGCFAARGRWVAALQLHRRDAGRPFRRSGVAFMRQMAPRIGEALRRAMRSEPPRRAEAGADPPPASGVLLLDRLGRPTFQTPAAEDWRRALGHPGGELPAAVLAAAARVRASHAEGIVPVDSAMRPARVEASPAGDGETIAVVFNLQRPALGLVTPLAWELTPAERRVVELALREASNADIAARLFVSEDTVRTHPGHVYAKLGVRGRNQLLARYFDETINGVDLGVSSGSVRLHH